MKVFSHFSLFPIGWGEGWGEGFFFGLVALLIIAC
jgi:hypothetical protein